MLCGLQLRFSFWTIFTFLPIFDTNWFILGVILNFKISFDHEFQLKWEQINTINCRSCSYERQKNQNKQNRFFKNIDWNAEKNTNFLNPERENNKEKEKKKPHPNMVLFVVHHVSAWIKYDQRLLFVVCHKRDYTNALAFVYSFVHLFDSIS